MLDYGVGSEFYYPNLFFMSAPVLRLLGFSAISALKNFYIFCTFSSLLTMYIAGKKTDSAETYAVFLLHCFMHLRHIG